jgi:hypothetical protein
VEVDNGPQAAAADLGAAAFKAVVPGLSMARAAPAEE